MGRLGKLAAPKARAAPPYMRMLEPSFEAPEAKQPAAKPSES